jgi:Xaa-Pro aminopeptidase
MFSVETYQQRQTQLIQHLKGESGLLVFMGNELCPMNYPDNTFPFRQDSSFLYFFGLDIPSLATVIDLDDGTQTLFGNNLMVEEVVWMGYQPTMQSRAEMCGISKTASLEQFSETIQKAQQQGRSVHFLPQYQSQNRIKLDHMFGCSTTAVDDFVSEPFTRAVIAMRSIKSTEEIEQIEQALQVTQKMHCLAMQITRPGMTENQMVAAMMQKVLQQNCRMAFPVIFTRHGEILHNHFSANKLKEGDLVINDSGVESPMHYASDITRTIPVSDRFSSRQKPFYDLVLNALNHSIEKIAPAVPFKDIHLHACRILTEGLIELGLMKGNPDDAVQQGAHALFFPCGLGHMMGLDVHDMEGLCEDWVGYTKNIQRSNQFGLRSLRLAKELESGFVLTVEPGIYFIRPLIEQWHQQNKYLDFICYDKLEDYMDFGGIRIEDNIYVTDDGYRLLSGGIPKTIEDVEALCS